MKNNILQVTAQCIMLEKLTTNIKLETNKDGGKFCQESGWNTQNMKKIE